MTLYIRAPQRKRYARAALSLSLVFSFNDLKEGLEEANAYEKETEKAKEKTYMILPVKQYSSKEIRDIRIKAGMTQNAFASYMGVSFKTVEAWEGGRTHPTGPVFRLLEILSAGENVEYIVVR